MVGLVMLMVEFLFIRAASRKPLNRMSIDEGRSAEKSIGPMLTERTLRMCMNSSRVFQKMEKLEGLGIPVFVQFNETAHAKGTNVQLASTRFSQVLSVPECCLLLKFPSVNGKHHQYMVAYEMKSHSQNISPDSTLQDNWKFE